MAGPDAEAASIARRPLWVEVQNGRQLTPWYLRGWCCVWEGGGGVMYESLYGMSNDETERKSAHGGNTRVRWEEVTK